MFICTTADRQKMLVTKPEMLPNIQSSLHRNNKFESTVNSQQSTVNRQHHLTVLPEMI
ncbi:MAG: hypothetical protein WBA89_07540 [Microcoleus sp.]|uniref:hypothetical protein n=1 Tax=Microcoleus sp. TaxID=44472 RepID=UPI003C778A25